VSLAKAVVLPNGNKILTFFGTKDLSLVKNFKIANVEDIGFFITNIIEKKEEPKEATPLYIERSYGIFENRAKNEQIFRKFEKIREIIKNS
jgi:hypothetical protein